MALVQHHGAAEPEHEPGPISRAWLGDLAAALPAVAGIAVVVAWSTDQGGYFPRAWYPGALFLLGVLAVTAATDRRSFRELPRTTRVALAAFALFTAWTYLSITWGDATGVAWDGANRTLLYLIVFALFSRSVASVRSLAIALGAVVAAIAVLAAVVLLKLPEMLGGGPPLVVPGLEQPFGYSNANAAIWLMALWPALALAACRDVAPWLRGAAAGAIVVLAETSLLSESRGALVATAIVLVVMFVVVPGRARMLVTLLAPAVGIAVVTQHVLRAANAAARDPDAIPRLGSVAAPVLLAALASGLVVFAASTIHARRPPRAARVRVARRALVVVSLGAVLLGVAGGLIAVGDPVDGVRSTWQDFKRSGAPSQDSPGHLTSGVGGARYDYYRVALDVFAEHPLVGIGIDNFAQDYLARGRALERPKSPHSLELRTLLQTGVVGSGLLLVALGASLAGAVRTMRRADGLVRAIAAGGALCCLYWIVHGSADWFWEFPALGGLAFACLGLAAAAAPRRTALGAAHDRGGSNAPLRVVVVVSGLAAAATLSFPWLADIEVRRAQTASIAFPVAARNQLELAATLNPLSEQPGITAGSIAIRRGEVDRARRGFEQALSRDPRNAYATLWLGAIASHEGDRARARGLLARAQRLAPTDPVTRSAVARARAGRIDLTGLARELDDYARQLHE